MSASPQHDYSQAPTNQQLDHIQGEYGLPFVGKTIAMFADPIRTFHQHYQQFGAVSRISITGQKAVLLLGPQYLQTILLDTERNFSVKKGWDIFMSDFFAGGLLMRDFDEHRMHRRIMQTAFKSENMREYSEIIHRIVQKAVAQWQKKNNLYTFISKSKNCYSALPLKCFAKLTRKTVMKKTSIALLLI